MRYFVTIGDRTLEVDLTGPIPRVEGEPIPAEMAAVPGTHLRHLLLDGESVALLALPGEGRGHWVIGIDGERLRAEAVDERTRAIREMTGGGGEPQERRVTAPMPGLVVRIEVEEGQAVRSGDAVAVIEAMKMENELRAPADGVVARVEVQPGQTVDKGTVLLVLE